LQNRGLNNAPLSWTSEESASGHYAQLLLKGLESYSPNGSQRIHILWNIKKVENGAYTIQNKGLNALLSWANAESSSGHYVQLLTKKTEYYEPNNSQRIHVLWDINPAENDSFTIHNRGLNGAAMTWTNAEASSGHYLQLLTKGVDYYLPFASQRIHVLWDFVKVDQI